MRTHPDMPKYVLRPLNSWASKLYTHTLYNRTVDYEVSSNTLHILPHSYMTDLGYVTLEMHHCSLLNAEQKRLPSDR